MIDHWPALASRSSRPRRGALLLLVLYVALSSGVGAPLLSGLASLDRSHTSCIALSGDQFRLVLHHAGTAAETSGHRHGVVARCLCLLAGPSPMNADHRLELPKGLQYEPANAPEGWAVSSSRVLPGALTLDDPRKSRTVLIAAGRRPFPHGPRASFDALGEARSTILVI